jgi:hypothetical protein
LQIDIPRMRIEKVDGLVNDIYKTIITPISRPQNLCARRISFENNNPSFQDLIRILKNTFIQNRAMAREAIRHI